VTGLTDHLEQRLTDDTQYDDPSTDLAILTLPEQPLAYWRQGQSASFNADKIFLGKWKMEGKSK